MLAQTELTRSKRSAPCGGRILRSFGAGVLGLGALAVGLPLLARSIYSRWGATDEEVRMALPGDGLVPNPVTQSTRAITIAVTPGSIWPWLIQMGQGRGGLYSYDFLENLVGCDMHSADRIVPEWQDLAIGDVVRMVPESMQGGPKYLVAEIHPERALVLQTPPESEETAEFTSSWAFVLNPLENETTRLIVRTRSFSSPGWVAPLFGVEPLHFVMEEKMMRGIKMRAEWTGLEPLQ